MFTGLARYQLDDRMRVPLPPGFRDAFKPHGWVVLSSNNSLEVHTKQSFEELEKKLTAWPDEADLDEALDEFYASATEVTPDSQGRISLPDDWAADAGFQPKTPIVVAGRGSFLRLWTPEAWEAGAAARRAARARIAGRGHTRGEA